MLEELLVQASHEKRESHPKPTRKEIAEAMLDQIRGPESYDFQNTLSNMLLRTTELNAIISELPAGPSEQRKKILQCANSFPLDTLTINPNETDSETERIFIGCPTEYIEGVYETAQTWANEDGTYKAAAKGLYSVIGSQDQFYKKRKEGKIRILAQDKPLVELEKLIGMGEVFDYIIADFSFVANKLRYLETIQQLLSDHGRAEIIIETKSTPKTDAVEDNNGSIMLANYLIDQYPNVFTLQITQNGHVISMSKKPPLHFPDYEIEIPLEQNNSNPGVFWSIDRKVEPVQAGVDVQMVMYEDYKILTDIFKNKIPGALGDFSATAQKELTKTKKNLLHSKWIKFLNLAEAQLLKREDPNRVSNVWFDKSYWQIYHRKQGDLMEPYPLQDGSVSGYQKLFLVAVEWIHRLAQDIDPQRAIMHYDEKSGAQQYVSGLLDEVEVILEPRNLIAEHSGALPFNLTEETWLQLNTPDKKLAAFLLLRDRMRHLFQGELSILALDSKHIGPITDIDQLYATALQNRAMQENKDGSINEQSVSIKQEEIENGRYSWFKKSFGAYKTALEFMKTLLADPLVSSCEYSMMSDAENTTVTNFIRDARRLKQPLEAIRREVSGICLKYQQLAETGDPSARWFMALNEVIQRLPDEAVDRVNGIELTPLRLSVEDEAHEIMMHLYEVLIPEYKTQSPAREKVNKRESTSESIKKALDKTGSFLSRSAKEVVRKGTEALKKKEPYVAMAVGAALRPLLYHGLGVDPGAIDVSMKTIGLTAGLSFTPLVIGEMLANEEKWKKVFRIGQRIAVDASMVAAGSQLEAGAESVTASVLQTVHGIAPVLEQGHVEHTGSDIRPTTPTVSGEIESNDVRQVVSQPSGLEPAQPITTTEEFLRNMPTESGAVGIGGSNWSAAQQVVEQLAQAPNTSPLTSSGQIFLIDAITKVTEPMHTHLKPADTISYSPETLKAIGVQLRDSIATVRQVLSVGGTLEVPVTSEDLVKLEAVANAFITTQ